MAETQLNSAPDECSSVTLKLAHRSLTWAVYEEDGRRSQATVISESSLLFILLRAWALERFLFFHRRSATCLFVDSCAFSRLVLHHNRESACKQIVMIYRQFSFAPLALHVAHNFPSIRGESNTWVLRVCDVFVVSALLLGARASLLNIQSQCKQVPVQVAIKRAMRVSGAFTGRNDDVDGYRNVLRATTESELNA